MARGVERLLRIGEDERPAERIQRENAAALREMDELGNTRDAAWKLAGAIRRIVKGAGYCAAPSPRQTSPPSPRNETSVGLRVPMPPGRVVLLPLRHIIQLTY
jgi:hypothetical protein